MFLGPTKPQTIWPYSSCVLNATAASARGARKAACSTNLTDLIKIFETNIRCLVLNLTLIDPLDHQ